MDQPGLAATAHAAALAGLARLNWASRASKSVWTTIRRVCDTPADRPLRILDLAAGGGDVLRGVVGWAERSGVGVEAVGLDRSATAVALANERTAAGAPIRFAVADVLGDDLPCDFDVVTSTLFLHHLDETDGVRLIRSMANAARRALVISDLRRSRAGLVMANVACRVLSRSSVVHYDGPQSVRAAFTISEVAALGRRAGLEGLRVTPAWPERLIASWRRPTG